MQALIDSHLFCNNLTTQELLRTAYMWKFDKDIPYTSLNEDAAKYDKYGQSPPYLVAYIINCYGVT